MNDDKRRELLPDSLKYLAEIVPLETVMALVEKFGGTEVFIPQNPSARTTLFKALGRNHAVAISRALGSGRLDVPTCARIRRNERDESIVQRYKVLRSTRKVAREFGVCLMTVKRAIQAHELQEQRAPRNPKTDRSRSNR